MPKRLWLTVLALTASACSTPATDPTAAAVTYEGGSTLDAANVQAALDELAARSTTLSVRQDQLNADVAALPTSHAAADVSFAPGELDLTATDVQAALVALAGRVAELEKQQSDAQKASDAQQLAIDGLDAALDIQTTALMAMQIALADLDPTAAACPEGSSSIPLTDVCIEDEGRGPFDLLAAIDSCMSLRGHICTMPERILAQQTGDFVEMTSTFADNDQLVLFSGTTFVTDVTAHRSDSHPFRCCIHRSQLAYTKE